MHAKDFGFSILNHSTLIMHSDGLSTRVSEELTSIDCIDEMSAGIIAASVFLYQAKRSDDATIMVVKQNDDLHNG